MHSTLGEASYELVGSVEDRRLRPAILFDGDDTLWMTEQLYDDARQQAARVVAEQGLDRLDWDRRERRIDVANVRLFGLSAERFPTSCLEAYREVCEVAGRHIDTSVETLVSAAAKSVFDQRAPLVDDAESTLKALWPDHSLILLTQGDIAVQKRRIAESGLRDLFDTAIVTPAKSDLVLRYVLQRLCIDPADAVFVGNSVASDINPAMTVGMRAVWIDAHVWDHERREALADFDGLLTVGDRLQDLPALLDS